MLEDVIAFLRCPHCSAELAAAGGVLRCRRGHDFDVARQGYVSLLGGGPRAGAGDSAAMVAARERFLGAGWFDPLSDALAAAAREAPRDGPVLDLGAGTAHHLARLLRRLPPRAGIALELSQPALRRAARAHPRVGAVGCDLWGTLPLAAGVAGLALDVFAPRNGAETARVLRPDGLLLVVTPSARHLAEVAELGLLSVHPRKQDRLEAELGAHFDELERRELDWPMRLEPAALEALVAMGPGARHVDPGTLRARAERTGPALVTASLVLSVFRRRPGGAQEAPAA